MGMELIVHQIHSDRISPAGDFKIQHSDQRKGFRREGANENKRQSNGISGRDGPAHSSLLGPEQHAQMIAVIVRFDGVA